MYLNSSCVSVVRICIVGWFANSQSATCVVVPEEAKASVERKNPMMHMATNIIYAHEL